MIHAALARGSEAGKEASVNSAAKRHDKWNIALEALNSLKRVPQFKRVSHNHPS